MYELDFKLLNSIKDTNAILRVFILTSSSQIQKWVLHQPRYDHEREQARRKLIFYFIAEQLPQKLSSEDIAAYESERTSSIGVPRMLWMTASLVGPLALAVWRRKSILSNPGAISRNLIIGGLLTPFVVSVHTRVYQSRFVQSSNVLNSLAQKYKFGVYDFTVAKKEAHILNLLYTMDAPYEQLHQ